MTEKIQLELFIRQELAALIDALIQQTGFEMEDLINRGIFTYYPEIFIKSSIKEINIWFFFDKREQFLLNEILDKYQLSEENLFYSLFGLGEQKTK